jgi:archaellum component FlaC
MMMKNNKKNTDDNGSRNRKNDLILPVKPVRSGKTYNQIDDSYNQIDDSYYRIDDSYNQIDNSYNRINDSYNRIVNLVVGFADSYVRFRIISTCN